MKGPIPFPLGLTLGTDVCMIPRVYTLISTNQGTPIIPTLARPFAALNNVDRFTKKLLTNNEKQRLEEMPVGDRKGEVWKLAEWLAGRWAAKEAVIKAHAFRTGPEGAGKLTFGGVEIVRSALGRLTRPPTAVILGDENSGVRAQMALLSISHDGDYATAVCLGFKPEAFKGKK
ncbi:hypothetical protein B0T21DRAFT_297825 [Apiosordaria backusii]|uniref:4'-phosphopantetheinyl transferase domain-containing protein n=1 Tax=Apiosordaria backusii TaxID=314023 RepID=A0AA40AA80_9PEZI|nr:hypothetical protein B0T21DRAFT_297825 [Apiosordaria backusii]